MWKDSIAIESSFDIYLNLITILKDAFGHGNPRHGVKMMLLRKNGDEVNNKNNHAEEKYDKEGFAYEIYGEGYGLEDIKKLLNKFNKQVGNLKKTDDEWEEIEDEDNKKANQNKSGDSDDEMEIDEEDILEMFIMENTKLLKNGTFNCNLCKDGKKISQMNIDIHFSKKHKADYEKSEHAKEGKIY